MRHDPNVRIHALGCRCAHCAPHRRCSAIVDLAISCAVTIAFAGALSGAALAIIITIANR